MQNIIRSIRYQSSLQEVSFPAPRTFVTPAAMSGLFLTMAASMCVACGAWRLGVDPGWTKSFFITTGLLSHYQSWFAVAIAAQSSALVVNRWANQTLGRRVPAVVIKQANPQGGELICMPEKQLPIAA